MNKFSKLGLVSVVALSISGISFLGESTNGANTVYAKAQQTALGAGSFKVGKSKDIKPGRYIIKATNGSGNVSNSTGSLNLILGQTPDENSGQVDSYTTTLKKGDTVQLEGIESTSFSPAGKRTYKTQLNAGDWVVGKDIKPGRYIITAISGSGNISTDDGDVNEILGTTSDENSGQVTKVTADLTKGQVLSTGLEQINLAKD
ncbi:hypothetical protein [Liquorilactobacillus capillatus]|uniref:Cell surface protein n=1 Tax=Liquorilactobacillus capillatus DSM 19910 TaxID=1423731 RepID=A0A0R1M324_9LACO|nr:hypothetical protein [Liquorilactobacillus capillatus]KRL00116.1 hypothetical protein FC81_GL000493 [Liquorilactobacillus capillatus DSM 19910]